MSAQKKLDFESAMSELEKIVEDLESEEISLEESLKKFERGVELYRFCQKELNKVEEKVKVLISKLGEEEIISEETDVSEFLEEEE